MTDTNDATPTGEDEEDVQPRPSFLESDEEFEGIGAHRDNPRYDPVDE